MSVLVEGGKIYLSDNCSVEDAERLLILLQSHPDFPVDIGEATNLHAAVLQVLIAFRRKIIGDSRDPFLQKWVTPAVIAGNVEPF